MSQAVISALRELAEDNVLSDAEAAAVLELAHQIEAAGPPSKTANPVTSDLSVFIKNIKLLGWGPAFVQFVKDVLNIKD